MTKGSFYGDTPNYATSYPTQNDVNTQPVTGNTAAKSSFYPTGPFETLNGQANGNMLPLMNGVAAVGVSANASHEDHVHPTDTTRAPTVAPVFTGGVTISSGNLNVTASITAGPQIYMGSGGTGGAVAQLFIDGGSGAGGGPYMEWRKNGATKWQFGTLSVTNSSTSDDFYIYDQPGNINALVIAAATGAVKLNSAVATTNSTTGALTVTGGVGVGGALYAHGNISTDANIFGAGLGVSNVTISGLPGASGLDIEDRVNSGHGYTLYVSSNIFRIYSNAAGSDKFSVNETGDASVTGNLSVGGNALSISNAGQIAVNVNHSGGGGIYFHDAGAGTDLKYFQYFNQGGVTTFRALTDAGAVKYNFFQMDHSTGIVTAQNQVVSAAGGAGGGSSILVGLNGGSYGWRDNTQAVDNRIWDFLCTSGVFQLRAVNDANTVATAALSFSRSGSTVTQVNIPVTTSASSTTTGALVVGGGVGISGSLYVDKGCVLGVTSGPVTVSGNSIFQVQAGTASTSTATGAIVCSGGIGVAGQVTAGGLLYSTNGVLTSGANGIGYVTGAGGGGTVTQATSRTTAVTINKPTGAITMFSAAGSATWQQFNVNNSTVVATDTVVLSVKGGASNTYVMSVINVGTGVFSIAFATTGGTATDAPVVNFTVIKGSTN